MHAWIYWDSADPNNEGWAWRIRFNDDTEASGPLTRRKMKHAGITHLLRDLRSGLAKEVKTRLDALSWYPLRDGSLGWETR